MTATAYGELIETRTVRIERTLPGTVERVWAYLTDSDLRAQWLAAGEMEASPGGRVEFVWRNDELSGPDQRPEGEPEEHRMTCEIIRAEPPRLLVLSWGASGSEVTFELTPKDGEVTLVLTHRGLPTRDMLVGVSAGWHAHLDLLVMDLHGAERQAFWPNLKRLRVAYRARIPA